ncbi:MAG: thiopurine S-methyltransferase [Lysobacterales bacterium]
MKDEWLARWARGQTGWHEAGGSAALRKFWPRLAPGSRVLVPLCGKSADLLWLAQLGCDVTGVELSEVAVREFFSAADIPYEIETVGGLLRFRGLQHRLSVYCGDYFQFRAEPFDAVYDRAALAALPAGLRPAYAEHTRTLMKADATHLLITLEYDQSRADGPPFSVLADEVTTYWPELRRVGDKSALKNMPPKYHEAGLSEFVEAVWLSGPG